MALVLFKQKKREQKSLLQGDWLAVCAGMADGSFVLPPLTIPNLDKQQQQEVVWSLPF